MNKAEIYTLLRKMDIPFTVTEHKAVYNMVEAGSLHLPYPEAEAKNLLVRDDKHQHYYLLTVQGDKRVDLKAFRRTYGMRALSFASAEELAALLGLFPGAVTPLGLLNDGTCQVQLFLDSAFTEPPGCIGVHPNDNTATIWLQTADLIELLRRNGSIVHIADFS